MNFRPPDTTSSTALGNSYLLSVSVGLEIPDQKSEILNITIVHTVKYLLVKKREV